jgi:hypothetical protein
VRDGILVRVDSFDRRHGFVDALHPARRSRASGIVSFDPGLAARATDLALMTPVHLLA